MGPPFITAEWGGCRGQQDYRPGRTASMGPPFITAEWVGRHRCGAAGRSGFNGAAVHHGGVGPTPPAAACSDRGFNGAAVHHGGVGCRDPSPSCRRLLASMGPPFITAEWLEVGRALGQVEAGQLQWGRRSSRRSGARCIGPAWRAAQLQWGRRSSRRSGLAFNLEVHRKLKLQWGRRSSRRSGTDASTMKFTLSIMLQWGRRSSRRSGTVGAYDAVHIINSFNGAAVHHGGVAAISSRDSGVMAVLLQWGRRSSRRSGSTPAKKSRRPISGFNGAAVHHGGVARLLARRRCGHRASMGPPFITAEWGQAARNSSHHLARFNGAAVHHGGVAPSQRCPRMARWWLQWGRRSSRRSGELVSERVDARAHASMGPPFITAEWTLSALGRGKEGG